MLYGSSKWDKMTDADKEALITKILEPSFVSAKNGTLSPGQTIKNTFWSQLSPSYTAAGYDSFMAANQWITNRVKGLETKYALSFDYSISAPGAGSAPGSGGELPGGSGLPAPSSGSSNWQLYAGLALLAAAIGFAVYKKMNSKK